MLSIDILKSSYIIPYSLQTPPLLARLFKKICTRPYEFIGWAVESRLEPWNDLWGQAVGEGAVGTALKEIFCDHAL